MTLLQTTRWIDVCEVEAIWPDRGVAALIDEDQVAIFLLASGEVHAVSHRDPFTGSNVMARGLVGSSGDLPTVTSPLHKQRFDLRSGVCLDDAEVRLDTWAVEVHDGTVRVAVRSGDTEGP